MNYIFSLGGDNSNATVTIFIPKKKKTLKAKHGEEKTLIWVLLKLNRRIGVDESIFPKLHFTYWGSPKVLQQCSDILLLIILAFSQDNARLSSDGRSNSMDGDVNDNGKQRVLTQYDFSQKSHLTWLDIVTPFARRYCRK
ncbi:hypothetical protein MKW98_008317 [Papaver atlanticum]|uniref:Uncharacterized protein n=1 Tax=Papaver atlanticum TaxID=357466 RepID=A0AAD4THY2_9MAGN|nr:hypothetical protein MKW98_008317 [Papaver atlanticum]